MKTLISTALKYENNRLLVLDQRKLPQEMVWIDCKTPQDMFECIQTLAIRGAPLIGVCASLSAAQFAESGASNDDVVKAIAYLRTSRPTAVNLMNSLDALLKVVPEGMVAVVAEAERQFEEDKLLCTQIAEHGVGLFNPGDNILTHCNTGELVTTGCGTALGVIAKVYETFGNIHVYVDETRPLLQGGRLTAWELTRAKIPYHLICDNMAASLMRDGKVQAVILGSDRIALNGDFANKIGTYSLAVLAHHHNVPFYVAAPYTTIDQNMQSGHDIEIEQRKPDEVRGVSGAFGDVIWSPSDCNVYNPAFDVTPGELVTKFILDRGVFNYNELK